LTVRRAITLLASVLCTSISDRWKPLYPDRGNYQPGLEIGDSGRLMLTHKDPEVQVMLGLLENQRDHVMGIAAALAKENAELKARIIKLEVAEPENQDGNAI
jgi:hypothetical protein